MAAWWTLRRRRRRRRGRRGRRRRRRRKIDCSHMHYRCRVFFKNVGASHKLRPTPSWRVPSTWRWR
jgi:hypothetical protein